MTDWGTRKAKLREAIAQQDRARGRPLTDAEKLENLRKALAEHDSDCGYQDGQRCSCGADEFRDVARPRSQCCENRGGDQTYHNRSPKIIP